MKRKLSLLTLLACTLVGSACAPQAASETATPAPLGDLSTMESPVAGKPMTGEQDEMSVKAAGGANRFGFALFQNLHGQNKGKNLFISPTSLTQALGMTYMAASGQTASEMATVLHVGDPTGAEMGQSALQQALKGSDEKVTVSIANALWADPRYTFNRGFAERCLTSYGASVTTLAASPDEAARQINDWVGNATNRMITQLVTADALRGTSGVLTNAVYFKGKWTSPFKKSVTVQDMFHPEGGADYKIPMMRQRASFGYLGPEPGQGEGFQAVRMGYGDRGAWAMYAFLPKRGQSLAEFVATLTPENWEKWRSGFQNRPVDVTLPRFKAEWGDSVKSNLISLGMPTAFSGGAEFPGMFEQDGPFQISDVIHKTALKVTEEHTEAAAGSAVAMTKAAAPRPQPVPNVVFDRPFVCAIVHEETGAIAFLGAFYEPMPNTE